MSKEQGEENLCFVCFYPWSPVKNLHLMYLVYLFCVCLCKNKYIENCPCLQLFSRNSSFMVTQNIWVRDMFFMDNVLEREEKHILWKTKTVDNDIFSIKKKKKMQNKLIYNFRKRYNRLEVFFLQIGMSLSCCIKIKIPN